MPGAACCKPLLICTCLCVWTQDNSDLLPAGPYVCSFVHLLSQLWLHRTHQTELSFTAEIFDWKAQVKPILLTTAQHAKYQETGTCCFKWNKVTFNVISFPAVITTMSTVKEKKAIDQVSDNGGYVSWLWKFADKDLFVHVLNTSTTHLTSYWLNLISQDCPL